MKSPLLIIAILILSFPVYPQERIDILSIADVIILGASEYDVLGIWMDAAGDVNGDGLDDFVLGTNDSTGTPGVPTTDFVYILFGKKNFQSTIDLRSTTQDITIISDLSGQVRVAGLGDMNGDSFDDVLLGDVTYSDNGVFYSGEATILFGTKEMPLNVDIQDQPFRCVRIQGHRPRELVGYHVSNADDVNGDGFADALITNVGSAGEMESDAYLIYGGTDIPSLLTTPDIGDAGVRIRNFFSETGILLSISSPGDVNGDSYTDLLIGDNDSNEAEDYSYLIFGGRDMPAEIDLSNQGYQGVRFLSNPRQAFGREVSGTGDINGDGLPDFMISEPGADPQSIKSAGRVYLIYGATDYPTTIDVRNLGDRGFVINGLEDNQVLGQIIDQGIDLNLDGFTDPLMGSYSPEFDAAPLYCIFGGSLPRNINEANLNHFDRIEFFDSSDDDLGTGVANIGDVNDDGYDDLIIGDRFETFLDRFSAGKAYIIFNRPGRFKSLLQKSDLNDDGAVNHKDLFLFQEQWGVEE